MSTEVPEKVLDELHKEEPPAAGEAFPDLLVDMRRFIELKQQEAGLADQLKPITKEKDAIENRIIERMGEMGVPAIQVNGHVLSRTTRNYPSIKEGCKAKLIAALQAMGFGESIVTVNHPAFQSRINEWVREGTMPSGFDEMINVYEKFGLSVRKK